MEEKKKRVASPDSLTGPQEKFCILKAGGELNVEAYKQCYNTEKMQHQTITRKANHLYSLPHIKERIAQLKAPVIEKMQLTLEGHLNELERLKKKAEDANNFPSAIKAEELRGKASGLYVEKIDQNVTGNLTVEIVRYGGD